MRIKFNKIDIENLYLFFKFGLVGVVTALIYFFMIWFVDFVLSFEYKVSVSIAYLVSTIFHFVANRLFTFSAAKGQKNLQLIRYLVLWVINYLITLSVVSFCVESLHLTTYFGVLIAVLFTVFLGFILARYWVFKV